MNFLPAPQWSLWVNSPEEYERKLIPDIYLKPEVPEDVRLRFGDIKKLLLHAYYEYVFYDFAHQLSLLTLEMAITKFYEAETGLLRRKKDTLKDLMDWVYNQGYSEVTNKGFFDSVRWLRNQAAHPRDYSFAGPILKQSIEIVPRIINDLYEDKALRKQRQEHIAPLAAWLQQYENQGYIFEGAQGRWLVWRIYVPFADNKSTPITYSFLVIPIFELNPYREDKHFPPETILFRIEKLLIEPNSIKGVDSKTNTQAIISPITDKVNSKRFQAWLKELKALHDYHIIDRLAEGEASSFLSRERQAFQKK